MAESRGVFATAWPGEPGEAQRTFVVVGLPRGGTSMAARCLHELGVPMGRVGNATYEDADFVTLVNRLRAEGEAEAGIRDELRALIARRNAEHDVWGWKVPGLPVPGVIEALRNPCLVVVHRDTVALCSRMAASEGADFLAAYRHFGRLEAELHERVLSLSCPRLFVSYEKALADPDAFVSALARFAGVTDEVRRRAATEAVEPGGAQYLADTRAVAVHGNLDGVFDGRIMGWAARPGAPDEPVTVRVAIDGTHAFDAVTDIDRPDVSAHLAYLAGADDRGSSDAHGFGLVIPDELCDGGEHEVAVRVVGTEDFRIGDSPQRLRFPAK